MWEASRLKDGDCGLSDGSKAGDWRLPTRDEWLTTTAKALALRCGGPRLSDKSGSRCHRDDPVFPGAAAGQEYWSSSTLDGFGTTAWYMELTFGDTNSDLKSSTKRAWPVRGGR